MTQCRNLLPVDKIDEFKSWLESKGYKTVGKADYSPFGCIINRDFYRVYVRDRTHSGDKTVHASIYGKLIPLAKKFLKERNKK